MSKKSIDEFHIPVGRAVDELRRGRGAILSTGAKAFAFLPIESLSAGELSRLKKLPGAKLRVVITGARAKSLSLAKTSAATLSLDAQKLSLDQMRFFADPLAKPVRSPVAARKAGKEDALAIMLVKYASLLPALLIIEAKHIARLLPWQNVAVSDIEHYMQTPIIEMNETARAQLPIEGAEQTTLMSFRQKHGTSVHLALIIGEAGKIPLTRIHSSCITGDILGSLRCDCGDQLKLAMDKLIESGGGILLYLHQEGRGIGITNKLRAYALQERDIDTYDANLMLGFEEDERDFAIAAAILKKLGIKKIRLLTNNPQKIVSLKKHGIAVAERVPLVVKPGRHNHAYLNAKAKKSGHLL